MKNFERDLKFEWQVREQTLRNLYVLEKVLSKFNNQNRKARAYYRAMSDVPIQLSRSVTVFSNELETIRQIIRELVCNDPLYFRDGFTYDRCKRFSIETMEGEYTYTFDKTLHWLDEFMDAARNKRIPRSKPTHFRIGDEFYDKGNYIEYQGKAYSKKEYALSGTGELIDLSKALYVGIDSQFYSHGDYKKFKVDEWLTSADDEEFVCIDEDNNAPFKLFVREQNNGYGNYSFLPLNFYMSMFRFGKKRYFYRSNAGSYGSIKLTKEMIKQMEFAPTKEHKAVWMAIKDKRDWFEQHYDVGMPFMDDNATTVRWALQFNRDCVKTAGIKDKIIRALCEDNRMNYTVIGSILNKLKALKDLYETEDKYEQSK